MFWQSKITNRQGRMAEETALTFLKSQGLTLFRQNYACKAGEIDLVMRDGETLVFVEVRFRSRSCFGTPEESVNYHKQQRLIRAARHFLQTFRLTDKHPCRLDIITFQPNKDSHAAPAINWLKNAFEC